jgi:hypothetical protein
LGTSVGDVSEEIVDYIHTYLDVMRFLLDEHEAVFSFSLRFLLFFFSFHFFFVSCSYMPPFSTTYDLDPPIRLLPPLPFF